MESTAELQNGNEQEKWNRQQTNLFFVFFATFLCSTLFDLAGGQKLEVRTHNIKYMADHKIIILFLNTKLEVILFILQCCSGLSTHSTSSSSFCFIFYFLSLNSNRNNLVCNIVHM